MPSALKVCKNCKGACLITTSRVDHYGGFYRLEKCTVCKGTGKESPRILVACEFSGVVRESFAALGWDAYSCDLLESEKPSPNHIKGDVIELLYNPKRGQPRHFHLMIAHPTCQYIANSSAKHLYKGMKKENGRDGQRWKQMRAGAAFFKMLWCAPVPHICIENPVMLGYAQRLIGCGSPSQVIQPYHHGVLQCKATGLWVRNLPLLTPSNNVKAETFALPYAERAKVHYASPGPDRWKVRSRTFPGIAKALALQYTQALFPELLAGMKRPKRSRL